MRIAAIADQHGFLPEIPECDLLLIGGDINPVSMSHHPVTQREWMKTNLRTWLESLPVKHIVAVAGNHDFVFEKNMHPRDLPWWYLQDSGCTIEGLKIWGTPWQPWFYSWAFNLATEEEMAEKWALIPEDTDILLLHGPPYGLGDKTVEGDRTGSKTLRKRIAEVKPSLVISGHIHEDRGIRHYSGAQVVNASLVNRRYQLVNEVVVLDVD